MTDEPASPPHPGADPAAARLTLEEQLRRSEQRFRAIAESARDHIFCKDDQRRYTYVNPAMCALFGVDAADLLGRVPEELFDEAGAAQVREVDDAAFAGEMVSEVRALEVGGESRVFHTVQVPLRDEDGAVRDICGIVRDVTRRARAEEDVRRAKELVEGVVASSFDGIHAFDRECRFLEWNGGMERLTGMRRDDVFGRVAFEVLPSLILVGADRFYRLALAGEVTRQERITLDIPGGGRRSVVEANISPLRYRDGSVRGGVAVFREVERAPTG